MKSKNCPSPLAGEGEGKIETLPKRITFFIEPDGKVTISDLFAEVLPLALSLNPKDNRIRKFIKNSQLTADGGQQKTESG